jgi:hypothetical protein
LLTARPAAAISGPAILNGVVLDSAGKPVEGVEIVLVSNNGLYRVETKSGADGCFALGGIQPGGYTLLIEKFDPSSVLFEPEQSLFLRIDLRTGSLHWLDLTDVSARTVIDDFQVQSMPSANNIWSLLENQDFSATTNRIDVGGVWASLPALWSSRGSVSWTQSSYLINGLEASDPYNTGTPLFYPDLEALQFVTHNNGRNPIDHLSPGGAFDLVPKQGTGEFHGALSASITMPGMSSGSTPSRLQEEGLFERTRLNSFQNYSAQFSGPIFKEKLLVFASLSQLSLNRDVAEFGPDDKGSVSSALVNLSYQFGRSTLHVFWTGQAVHHPTAGAARDVPLSDTLDRKNLYNVFQVIWNTRFRPDHHFELGAAFNHGHFHSQFQDGVSEPHGLEVFRNIPSGAAASAGQDDRTTVILQGKGQALFGRPSRLRHRVDYGLSLRSLHQRKRSSTTSIFITWTGSLSKSFGSILPSATGKNPLTLIFLSRIILHFGTWPHSRAGFILSRRGAGPQASARCPTGKEERSIGSTWLPA